MNENEFSGKSVDEAVAAGLKALGLRSDQVQIDVLQKGSRGLFGLGSEPALVRLTPKAQPVSAEVSIPVEPLIVAETPATQPVVAQTLASTSSGTTRSQDVPQAAQNPSTTQSVTAPVDDRETGEPIIDESDTEQAAIDILSQLLEKMGLSATIDPVWRDSDDEHEGRVLWLEVRGRDLGGLIGRRGETLENLQYLLRMMVNQRLHCWNDIVVDIDEYRIRRAEQLMQLAQRMAEQVVSGGRAISLEPMPPNERRVIHMALRDHPQVYTQSSGEGDRRKVFIVLKS